MSKNKLKKDSKEWLKILIFCMCLTGLWGFLHEQLFVSVFVSSVIQKDPTHILKNANVIERSAWGAARTMWYGIFIFIPVTMVARLGKKNKLTAQRLIPHGLRFLLGVFLFSFSLGILGYFLQKWGILGTKIEIPDFIKADKESFYVANLFSLLGAYFGGVFATIRFCYFIHKKRKGK